MPLRPRLTLLTGEEMDRIHQESLSILEEVGVTVHSNEAVDLLDQAGCPVDRERMRVQIPSSLVEEQLRKAPSSITLYSREGEPVLRLEGDRVHFNPGSAATHLLDPETGERRPPVSKDLVEFARLVDALPYIDAQSTALVPSDVPHRIADRYRLYLVLQNSVKPIVTGTFASDAFSDMLRMLEAVAGGPRKLRDKPLAIFDVCPSAPLQWSILTVGDLLSCAKSGVPSEIIPMPQLGATGPVTLAGSLVQHNAEFLSGLVLAQLASPGAPVIYGGSPTSLDMRYGTSRLGAIETVMLTCAYVEMAKRYGLPSHGYLGLSDTKLACDAQTGLEAATGLLLGALAGVNNIAGPGMLDFENTQSFEKLLIDNLICGMVRRLLEGVNVNDETLAGEAIRRVAVRGGSFLTLRHTINWLRREHYIPGDLLDRQTYQAWKEQGALDSLQRARKRVKEILTTHHPPPLSSAQQEALDEVARSFAQRHQAKLPIGPS